MTNLQKIQEIMQGVTTCNVYYFEKSPDLDKILSQENDYIKKIRMFNVLLTNYAWLKKYDLIDELIPNSWDFSTSKSNKIYIGINPKRLSKNLVVETNNPDEVEELQSKKWDSLPLLEKIEMLLQFVKNELEKVVKYKLWLNDEFEQIQDYEPYGEYEQD